MAATTMQLTNRTIDRIKRSFGQYSFGVSDDFRWSPEEQLITHPPFTASNDIWTLLHEISHAELHHSLFYLDIELINQEAEAWEHARTVLAPKFGMAIDDDHIQDHLDTYRVWLHQRSKCPRCGHNGLQTTQNTYNCSNCRCLWRVNDARGCALRRTKL